MASSAAGALECLACTPGTSIASYGLCYYQHITLMYCLRPDCPWKGKKSVQKFAYKLRLKKMQDSLMGILYQRILLDCCIGGIYVIYEIKGADSQCSCIALSKKQDAYMY